MTTQATTRRWANPWRIAGWGIAALLLLLPLVAMRFTTEVDWSPGDFLFAAVLIGGVGGAIELAVRAMPDWTYRAGAMVALAVLFLMVWINAAVGIIGDEDDPLNLLYLGVVAIAIGGGVLARFRAAGLARAMAAAAIATAIVGVVAVAAGHKHPPGAAGLAAINAFFVALFALAGYLFRRTTQKLMTRPLD